MKTIATILFLTGVVLGFFLGCAAMTAALQH